MAGIYSLLLNNPNMSEVDTNAAEAAVRGGFAGSQFGVNNNLRLRDSEKIAREVQGQALLQPYLDRASRESMTAAEIAAREKLAAQQNQFELGRIGAQTQAQRELAELEQKGALERVGAETAGRAALEQLQQGGESARQRESIGAQQQNLQAQIAAEAARQAISESGATSRLNAEQQAALHRALIEGDQRMQQIILSEAGATARQRDQIAAHLQETNLNARNELLRTILPFALQKPTSTASRIGPYTDARNDFDWTSQTFTATPAARPITSSGNGNILSRVDEVLRRYNIQ